MSRRAWRTRSSSSIGPDVLARPEWVPLRPTRHVDKPLRLGRRRRSKLAEAIATMMRDARDAGAPTLFTYEATCRRGIRAALCLQGWPWSVADVTADEAVQRALGLVGAERPSWEEGQPEWTLEDRSLPIERERCARCHKPLPEASWKFCSGLCRRAFHMDRWNRRQASERLASNRAAQMTGDLLR